MKKITNPTKRNISLWFLYRIFNKIGREWNAKNMARALDKKSVQAIIESYPLDQKIVPYDFQMKLVEALGLNAKEYESIRSDI